MICSTGYEAKRGSQIATTVTGLTILNIINHQIPGALLIKGSLLRHICSHINIINSSLVFAVSVAIAAVWKKSNEVSSEVHSQSINSKFVIYAVERNNVSAAVARGLALIAHRFLLAWISLHCDWTLFHFSSRHPD